MLNALIFTVDINILKKNQCIPRPVTIAIVYSFVERFHFIIMQNAYYLIIYSAISKEIIVFVNQARLR